MFVRADRLLKGEKVRWYSDHALWFYWEGFEPFLDVYGLEGGEVETLDLVGRLRHMDFSVSEERECVGSYEGERYVPCPKHVPLKGAFDQCRSCAGTWIPVQECLFEPQCAGDLCDSPLCRKRHVVYATFFGDVVKIGMTAGSRLRERAIEQGADAVVRLCEFPNRLSAREAEKDISKRLRCPQRVSAEQVAEELAKNPRGFELRAKYESIVSRIGAYYELMGENLQVLDGYPGRGVLRELGTRPEMAEVAGAHRGELIGIKGRFLYFEDQLDGQVMMLPLSELPSRFMELGGQKR